MGKDKVFSIARKGDVTKMKKYIPGSKYKIEDLDKENRSLLHHAIDGDQLTMVNYLLENGANINQKDPKTGDTPILTSLKKINSCDKQEDIAILLVNKGADLDVESRERKSVERYVDGCPKRFQIKYRDAVQQKFRSKYPPKAIPVADSKTQALLAQTAGLQISTSQSSLQQSPISSTPPPITLQQTPPVNNNINNNVPISIIPTVEPAPYVNSEGITVVKPQEIEILPKTLLDEDFDKEQDLNIIWLEVAYRASIVSIRSDKVRYDDITKATNDCGNILVHLLSIIGNSETTSFMETVRNQEAVNSIQERVKNVKEGIKLRLFSRIEHAELIRLVAALVGSLHWMYYCWSEVFQEDINRSIAECALSCRVAMNSVTSRTPFQMNVFTNVAKLLKNISTKVFITRSPENAKKLSDSCHTISSTFKSLMVLSIMNNNDPNSLKQRSAENIISLGRNIAEQLQILKIESAAILPSRVGSSLPSQQEIELCETASMQLRGSLDYYMENTPKIKIPKEDQTIPLLANIQKSMSLLSNFTTDQKNIQMAIPVQMIAQDIHNLRNILLEYVKSESDQLTEDFKDQITNAINCSAHFATQLLFSVSALICHNRISDIAQLGFSCRNISTCCRWMTEYS
ncbi:hypothetical protein DICPUDRAFT_150516 [Dictyostelium purpureum]|uniref:Uncharacterized protein n=1 Tax=Dictyostelium purpureum TaxID=5786 RepID=F0ZGI7_DICPU|nr:uncharacterized protein DICPUDRAFT_150516 [Dictyostelium purpureum]EGC36965.1 hypothetical protein DICPUDRAFT_150516 [Dictyostelium purpureum]|eukprot:XP_003286533.1 hypothetical protein DICPUDRAFT_150516 [Dictyostelium purpureum]